MDAYSQEKFKEIELKSCTEVLSKEIIAASNSQAIKFEDDDVFCVDPSDAELELFYDGNGESFSTLAI